MQGKKLTSGNTSKKESTSKNSVKVHVKALYGFPDEAGRAGAAAWRVTQVPGFPRSCHAPRPPLPSCLFPAAPRPSCCCCRSLHLLETFSGRLWVPVWLILNFALLIFCYVFITFCVYFSSRTSSTFHPTLRMGQWPKQLEITHFIPLWCRRMILLVFPNHSRPTWTFGLSLPLQDLVVLLHVRLKAK